MTLDEAKALVKVENRLPPHVAWIVDEARRVVAISGWRHATYEMHGNEIGWQRHSADGKFDGHDFDREAYVNEFDSLTPKRKETINMALVARLASCCRMLAPWQHVQLAEAA